MERSLTSLKPRDSWVFRVQLLVSLLLALFVASSVLASLVQLVLVPPQRSTRRTLFNSAASTNSFIKVEDQEKQKQCSLEAREALTHPLLPLSLLFG